MDFNELLPVGSVVLLHNGKKRVMVYGVKQTASGLEEDAQKEFDYIGVFYPEGFLGEGSSFLFNHRDVAEVFFRGYEDEERERFVEKLQQYYEKNSN